MHWVVRDPRAGGWLKSEFEIMGLLDATGDMFRSHVHVTGRRLPVRAACAPLSRARACCALQRPCQQPYGPSRGEWPLWPRSNWACQVAWHGLVRVALPEPTASRRCLHKGRFILSPLMHNQAVQTLQQLPI